MLLLLCAAGWFAKAQGNAPSRSPTTSPSDVGPTASPVVVGDLFRLEVRDAATYALVEKLDGGEVLNLDQLNVATFNILARPQYGTGVINSVVFSYNGVRMSIRNVPDLLWMCDEACNLGAGEVTISATPFSGPNGTGMVGETQTVTFMHAFPTSLTSDAPSSSHIGAPTSLPRNEPSDVPSQSPANTQTALPSDVPKDSPSQSPTIYDPNQVGEFEDILINCGAGVYYDTTGRKWSEDMYFEGGQTFNAGKQDVAATLNDHLYFSERFDVFNYEIPVPPVRSL